MLFTFTVAAMLAQAPAATPAEKPNPRIAVPDFQTSAGNESLAAMVAGSVATEIDRTGLFQVTTSDQVRALLSLERQRQLLGCSDDSCNSDIAGQLGVDYMLNGRLTRLVDSKKATTAVNLDLVMLEVKSGKRVSSREIKAGSEAELVSKLQEGVAGLIAPLLAGRQGFLVVIASEDGSIVKVDGTQLATTPMTQRLAIAGGPHVLRIEKEGFTAVQKQIRIAPDQMADEAIRLLPSPDYVEAYERKMWTLRIGAFSAAGMAVIGGVIFGVMQGQAQYNYRDANPSFLTLRNELATDESKRADAEALRNTINTQLAVSYVAGGVGIAAAVTSVVLLFVGEDPNRYQSYRGPRSAIWLAPGSGGTSFAFDF